MVGSLNLDTTLRVPRLPLPGETVLGTGRFSDTGGKGANQAVAAARLGRTVAMVGAVGDDDAGVALLRSLAEAGVDTAAVGVLDGIGSGMAVISVADTAENTIVVDPGANGALDPQQVRRAAAVLSAAAVTLAQLEIPIGAVATAAVLAGGRFVLNPAPAGPIPADVLERVSVLVPNASELGVLAGDAPPGSADEAARMARAVRGPGAVVVTLGAGGAVVVEGRRRRSRPGAFRRGGRSDGGRRCILRRPGRRAGPRARPGRCGAMGGALRGGRRHPMGSPGIVAVQRRGRGTGMIPRPIIIDTDPGQDDAVAILLALASPAELDVRAITAVAGNVPLPLTTVNALKMVELAGRTDVPVYAGCHRAPPVRPLITAEYVHGRTGLDGADLPEPVTPLAPGHAVDAIVEIVMGSAARDDHPLPAGAADQRRHRPGPGSRRWRRG